MHKKTPKNYHLTNRQKSPTTRGESRSSKMTILRRPSPSITPIIRVNGASKSRSTGSWDDCQTDNGSWSEEVEDTTSHKVVEHWLAIERMLYQEDEQLPQGPLFDECLQWRNQLLHLRLNGGKGSEIKTVGDRKSTGSKVNSAARKREASAKNYSKDETGLEPDIFSKELSIRSSSQQNQQHRQAKEQVLDHIVEYICRELAEIEAEKEAEAAEEDEEVADDGDGGGGGGEEEEEDEEELLLLSNELSDFLKIAPAPKSHDKNPLVSNNLHYNAEAASDNNNSSSSGPPTRRAGSGREQPEESKRDGRNKLGTVFNERIIVSPVPFVVTTRQSFTTLRKTPIHYIGDNHEVPFHRSGTRRDNTKRKLSLTRKTPLMPAAAPHLQPSWNTPVCPTVWPKSVKLTPIDTSRLPSSKRRPTKTADSILPLRRSRNSLSPISRSVQPVSPRLCERYQNHFEGLEVRGSHIDAQTSRLSKTKATRVKRAAS